MPTPSYNQFIGGVQEADLRALALLTNGNVIQTDNAVEAEAIFAQLNRLFDYNMISKPKRGWDKVDLDLPTEKVWYTFECRVTSTALNYIAQAAMERVILSRDPLPNT